MPHRIDSNIYRLRRGSICDRNLDGIIAVPDWGEVGLKRCTLSQLYGSGRSKIDGRWKENGPVPKLLTARSKSQWISIELLRSPQLVSPRAKPTEAKLAVCPGTEVARKLPHFLPIPHFAAVQLHANSHAAFQTRNLGVPNNLDSDLNKYHLSWFGTTRPLDGSAGISRNPGLRAWNIAGREFRIIRSCRPRSTLASGVAVQSSFGSGSSGGNLNSKRPSSSVIVAYRWSREKTRARLIASRVLRLRTLPRMDDPLSAELPLPATDCALAEPQSITQEKKIAKETVRSRTLWRRKTDNSGCLAGAAITAGSILANYYTEKSISLEGLVAVYPEDAAST
jgi:hypothetical protein